VQEYLTTHRAFLVSREYPVADNWEMYPDLLAVDFRAHQVWFVEITSGHETKKIEAKTRQFETDIVPRLKRRLVEFGIIPAANSDWRFGFWAFVRKARVDGLRKWIAKNAKNVKLCEVTALEEIAFSWAYWDKRRAEEVQTK
jgi:hypothetical protein